MEIIYDGIDLALFGYNWNVNACSSKRFVLNVSVSSEL